MGLREDTSISNVGIAPCLTRTKRLGDLEWLLDKDELRKWAQKHGFSEEDTARLWDVVSHFQK